jgi:hypothetical protein
MLSIINAILLFASGLIFMGLMVAAIITNWVFIKLYFVALAASVK